MRRWKSIMLLTAVIGLGLIHTHASVAQSASIPASSQWTFRGVTVVPTSPTSFGSTAFQASVREAALDGANTIGLVVPYYQRSLTSSGIYDQPTTPTSASLASAFDYVRSLHLKVMLKIFFDVQPLPGKYNSPWRWNINPNNRREWFANAERIEVSLAKLQPDLLVIGTEMGDLTSQQVNSSNGYFWAQLIGDVRKVDKRALTYDADAGIPTNAHNEATHLTFWHLLNYISFSGYNILPVPCGASISQLSAAWAKVGSVSYLPLARTLHMPMLFTEAGYSSVPCDHQAPWAYGSKKSPDLQEQANDYAAFFQYWSTEESMIGVSWWNWQPDPTAGGSGNNDFTPQNKPAEAVMRNAFLGNAVPQVSIWWPTSAYTFTHQEPYSLQPFKGVLGTFPLDFYTLYWSVDSGVWNLMTDATSGGIPCKFASVDLSPWTWNNDNQYVVTMIATTLGGEEVASDSVIITID